MKKNTVKYQLYALAAFALFLTCFVSSCKKDPVDPIKNAEELKKEKIEKKANEVRETAVLARTQPHKISRGVDNFIGAFFAKSNIEKPVFLDTVNAYDSLAVQKIKINGKNVENFRKLQIKCKEYQQLVR